MENIFYNKSELTPLIDFDKELRRLRIEGRCIPENAHSFFNPLIVWLDDLFVKVNPHKDEEYKLLIKCDYYNSASAKMFVYFFDKVAGIQQQGYSLKVNWFCKENDPDMIESVTDFTSITDAIIEVVTD